MDSGAGCGFVLVFVGCAGVCRISPDRGVSETGEVLSDRFISHASCRGRLIEVMWLCLGLVLGWFVFWIKGVAGVVVLFQL